MAKSNWWDRKTPRAVDQLKLWSKNPRLNPEEKHVSVADYALDLISDPAEKRDFNRLVDSIATRGFIPTDPIIVWQHEDTGKFVVAEGNRRVLALKLLRSPAKAPRSIRSYMRQKAQLVDRNDIEKIDVYVAPSFAECEWYINQRHANNSLQRPWSRLQQKRWIAELYDRHNGDIESVMAVTSWNKSELEGDLRILKIREFAEDPRILQKLDTEEKNKVLSHRIPLSILERWFENKQVRKAWGIQFDGEHVRIISNMDSFLTAYAYWLKLVVRKDDPDVKPRINTRTVPKENDKILAALPQVTFDNSGSPEEIGGADEENVGSNAGGNHQGTSQNGGDSEQGNGESGEETGQNGDDKTPDDKRPLNKNPDRNQLVVESCKLSTSSHKLDALFREFKKLPVYKYKNVTGASLRVFLDLAIAEYISSEGCKDELCREYSRAFQDITLKQRLEFIKQNKLQARTPACKVVDKLLNPNNEHSLDTLNNYIHGTDQQHTNKRFLNGFWDFLFPLFTEILDMREN